MAASSSRCGDETLSFPPGDEREDPRRDEQGGGDRPLQRAAALVGVDAEEQLYPFPGDEGQHGQSCRKHRQRNLNPESNSPVPHDSSPSPTRSFALEFCKGYARAVSGLPEWQFHYLHDSAFVRQ
jgi:hypothetical protein